MMGLLRIEAALLLLLTVVANSKEHRFGRLLSPRTHGNTARFDSWKCREIIERALLSFYGNDLKKTRRLSNSKMELLEHGGCQLTKCNYVLEYLKKKDAEHCWDASKIGQRCAEILRESRQKNGCPVKQLPQRNCTQTKSVPCDKAGAFRSFTGWGNNLKNPTWGILGSKQTRCVKNAYDDGKATPRTRSATTNKLLPSPRVVSNVIHKAGEAMEKESNLSYMIMQMGQFLSHDFIMTKSFTNDDETPLECCGDDKECSECFPISIPAGDTMNTTCLSFARSKSVFDCDGIRQQLNGQSSYLDLSCLYGTDEDAANELRLFKGGELNVSSTNNLPPDMDDSTCELEGSYDEAYNYCPMSGDPRVNENAGLSAFHTLLHRAHNIFARGLAFVNPHWKDEELFQNARKILVGIWQKIVYGDYLPLIVGEQAMKSHNINISPDGYKETYNVNTDATVTNEGGIAFRFGHSNIHRMMVLQDQDYKLSMTPEPLQLSYFKCKWYHAFNGRGHEDVLRWTADAACPRSDRLLEPSVQQTLFEDGRGISSDLAALNIQRGRDHGLGGYNVYRRQYGLSAASNFDANQEGLVDMDPEVAKLLQSVYSCPDDIDLFTAIITENRSNGTLVGPLGQKIISDMFKRLRDGDRFFFERDDPVVRFTKEQLAEIKKITLSSLICETTSTSTMQDNAFLFGVPKKPCNEFPKLNFNLWKSS